MTAIPAFLWKQLQNERLNRGSQSSRVNHGEITYWRFANADDHSEICYRSVMHLTVSADWKKEAGFI